MWRLIKETEEPEGNFVSTSHFGVVTCINRVGRSAETLCAVAHADVGLSVDLVTTWATLLAHLVMAPKGIDKEGLHNELVVHAGRIERIEHVRVVNQVSVH